MFLKQICVLVLRPDDTRVKGHNVALVLALVLIAITGIPAQARGFQPQRGSGSGMAKHVHAAALPMALRAAMWRVIRHGAMTVRPETSSLATTWTQQAELSDPPPQSFDLFGYSVIVDGDTALVGAPARNNAGAAYVFVRSGTTWAQQAVLSASDSSCFGYYTGALALSGNTALVGDACTNNFTGAMYVFVRNGTSWTQQAELRASDGAPDASFGNTVALSGDTALIGAPGPLFGYPASGVREAAYVFVRRGTTWSQQTELDDPTPLALSDNFAWSVALSGDRALIGAPGKNNGAGAAYVFAHHGASWIQEAALTANDGTPGDAFGWSVALSGDIAVLGAWGNNRSAGAAYVFARNGTIWMQQSKLTDSPPARSGDTFGWSVALSGDTALVGAVGKYNLAGAAYMFVRSGTTWTQMAELDAPPPAVSGDGFGLSVALDGNTALVGDECRNNCAGAAYVFVHR